MHVMELSLDLNEEIPLAHFEKGESHFHIIKTDCFYPSCIYSDTHDFFSKILRLENRSWGSLTKKTTFYKAKPTLSRVPIQTQSNELQGDIVFPKSEILYEPWP